MSEQINNRQHRLNLMKELVMELDRGKDMEEVKERFSQYFQQVSPMEIAQIETQLIAEGMPMEQIRRLCDVHAAVFKERVEKVHTPDWEEDTPGHPIHTFREENRLIQEFIDQQLRPHVLIMEDSDKVVVDLAADFEDLWEIDRHYRRKEDLLFPYLENSGVTVPPKIMWGAEDEIRSLIKEVRGLLKTYQYARPREEVVKKAKEAIQMVEEMISKEENILFPLVIESLNDNQWKKILEESDEYGYFFYEPKVEWTPKHYSKELEEAEEAVMKGQVKFDAGYLSLEEANAMLNSLPVDLTFVDKDGRVKYFTQGKDHIFARPKTIIGREVVNCHPPASAHIVRQVMEELETGKKDHEDFWINMGEKFVLVRYYAVRNHQGEFLGVVEVSQDIKPLKELKGEKRLVD